MTKHPDLFAALAAPFAASEVKARQQAGRDMQYVTARTVMNRLDTVLGPENWFDDYVPSENSVLCRLSIRLPDGTLLTKCDAGGYAGMADSGDDDKSGYSDAFKRAAVKFGVGRYLYRDGVASFGAAAPSEPPAVAGRVNGHSRERHEWPGKGPGTAGVPAGRGGNGTGTGIAPEAAPRVPSNGKSMYIWCKDQEARHGVGLLKYLNGWARLQQFPGRMVEWDADQVSQAHAEATRKLRDYQRSDDVQRELQG